MSLKQGVSLFLKIFYVPKIEGLAVPETVINKSLSLFKHLTLLVTKFFQILYRLVYNQVIT